MKAEREMNILKGEGEFNERVEMFLAFQSEELESLVPTVAEAGYSPLFRNSFHILQIIICFSDS